MMVPEPGIEPGRPYERGILSHCTPRKLPEAVKRYRQLQRDGMSLKA